MKTTETIELATLTQEEILCVGGSGGLPRKELRAEDMYGNTLSIEEWMDLQLDTANGIHRGEHTSLWDFYDPGFNGNKPNNRFP